MLTIVIPTYWKRNESAAAKAEDQVYDHPTALDGEDTLTRTLESLTKVEGDFNVVVVTATVHHEIDARVEARVGEIIGKFAGDYPVMQFAESDLVYLRRRMKEHGLQSSDISLEGYSSIRNCQLLIPSILGADIIAAIDDDELVDPDFAFRACEFAGNDIDGRRADGIGGRYFYEWGSYRVKEPESARSTENLFGRKHALQNDSYDLFDSRAGRVVETSIVLGGNMVFSRELFEAVPFDPLVTRGEDIDYLINSKILGFNWMLDKELKIYHYPPPCNPSHKLQEDIIRFVYEKRKIEVASELEGTEKIRMEELKPYPGEFFTDRLEDDALSALRARENLTGAEAFYLSPEQTLQKARDRADKAPDYFSFVDRWRNTVEKLGTDQVLKEYLQKRFL